MSAVALGGNSWYKSASTGANNACERYIVWLTPAYRHSRCPYKRFGAACTTNVLYVCSHWAGSTLLGTSWGHLVRAYRLEPSVSPRTYHQNGIKIFRKLVGLLSISWWPPATPCLMASRSHSPVTVNFFLGIPVLSLSLCVWGGGACFCLSLSQLAAFEDLTPSLSCSLLSSSLCVNISVPCAAIVHRIFSPIHTLPVGGGVCGLSQRSGFGNADRRVLPELM